MATTRTLLAALVALAAITPAASSPTRSASYAAARPRLGVFYFPGWSDAAAPDRGWDKIRPYPERKPVLGWYRQDDPAVMTRQLAWMGRGGLSFVAFDWYYNVGTTPLDSALSTYLKVPQRRVGFSLLWANHDEPTTPAEWEDITSIWIDRYFKDPRYLRVDRKPVVFVFLYPKLRTDAAKSGSSAAAYIARANAKARAAGLPGIYFVAGAQEDVSVPGNVQAVVADGANAVFAYNMHRKPEQDKETDPLWGRAFHGYGELQAAYRAQWQVARSLPLPYVVPMSAGWDHRPWGPSPDPLHDRSIGTPQELGEHLAEARREMMRPGPQHSGLGVICCWNEFGEGSFIEPTVADGDARLRQIRRVFGR